MLYALMALVVGDPAAACVEEMALRGVRRIEGVEDGRYSVRRDLGKAYLMNGAGDRDRTDDIQLGKRRKPGTGKCRERSRIDPFKVDVGMVAHLAKPSKSERNLAVCVLPDRRSDVSLGSGRGTG